MCFGVEFYSSARFLSLREAPAHYSFITKENKTTTTKTRKRRMIIAVIYTTFTVGKRKPEKNSGLYGIRTLDLCDTGSASTN